MGAQPPGRTPPCYNRFTSRTEPRMSDILYSFTSDDGLNVFELRETTLTNRLAGRVYLEAPLDRIESVTLTTPMLGGGGVVYVEVVFFKDGSRKTLVMTGALYHDAVAALLGALSQRLPERADWKDERKTQGVTASDGPHKLRLSRPLTLLIGRKHAAHGFLYLIGILFSLGCVTAPFLIWLMVTGFRATTHAQGITVRRIGATTIPWDDLREVQLSHQQLSTVGRGYTHLSYHLTVTLHRASGEPVAFEMEYTDAMPLLHTLIARGKLDAGVLQVYGLGALDAPS